MKIFDRHIAWSILAPLLGTLLTMMAIWVVYDLVERLNDFLNSDASLWDLAVFYLRQVPVMLPVIIPVSTLIATLSALVIMTRNGEVIALLSSGVSAARISLPFLFIGTIAGVCQFFAEIKHAPLALRARNEQINEYRAQARNRERRSGLRLRTVVYFHEKQNRIWFTRRADTARQELSDVEILQLDEEGRDVWKLFSRQMNYDDKAGWNTRGTRLINYLADGSVESDHEGISSSFLESLDESFTQVAAAVFTADVLTFSELRNFLANNQQLPAGRLAPYSSAVVRQAWSFAPCLGAVMIAFGLCFRASRRGGFSDAGIPIGLYILYLLLDKFCYSLGEGARLPPHVIVSTPHVMWLFFGVCLVIMRQRKFS